MHLNILNNVKSFVDYTLSNIVMEKVERRRRRKMTIVVMITIDREECLSVARDIRTPCLHHLVVRVYTRYSSSVYSAYFFDLTTLNSLYKDTTRYAIIQFLAQDVHKNFYKAKISNKLYINYT